MEKEENKDYVVCEICKSTFRRITRTHLKKHNLSTAEYIILYPTKNIICNSLRFETGKNFRMNNPMHDPVFLEKNSASRRGLKKSDEHKKKLSDSQQGDKSHLWNKKRPKHAEFMRERIQKMKEDGTFLPPKQVEWTDERRRNLSQSKKGKTPKQNPNRKSTKGCKMNLTDEQRRMRSFHSSMAIKSGKIPKKDTSIELMFKKWCNENEIIYEHQYILEHKNACWLFDFYIPQINLLVEIDGEYWHSKRKAINRDTLKERAAKENNFRFVRISDKNMIFDIIYETDDIINHHNNIIMNARISKLL